MLSLKASTQKYSGISVILSTHFLVKKNGDILKSFLQVKEQSMCTLWNLSVDEKLGVKIANSDILPLLIKSLDDDDIKLKEAAGGVLANLALSQINHSIMVEAGVIQKLVRLP